MYLPSAGLIKRYHELSPADGPGSSQTMDPGRNGDYRLLAAPEPAALPTLSAQGPVVRGWQGAGSAFAKSRSAPIGAPLGAGLALEKAGVVTSAPPSGDVDDPYGIMGGIAEVSLSEETLDGLAEQVEKALARMSDETDSEADSEAGSDVAPWGRAGAPPAPAGGAKHLVSSGDRCPDCTRAFEVRDLVYVCPGCGLIREAADISEVLPTAPATVRAGSRATQGRLRYVGADARYYQPGLDGSNPVESSEVQKRGTLQELQRYNTDYVTRGGNAFPATVLAEVAECYHQVRLEGVRRSYQKRAIISALLYYSCLHQGFSRRRSECALFSHLPTRGIAKGSNVVWDMDENLRNDPKRGGEGLGLNLNCDQIGPHTVTALHHLELPGGAESYLDLHAPIRELVEIACARHIGTESVLRTKVLTATFEVLRRSRAPVAPEVFYRKCGIRKNTVARFARNLEDYHEEYFREVYRRHGLNAESPQDLASPAGAAGGSRKPS